MGWTYYSHQHPLAYKSGKVDRKATVDRLYTWADERTQVKVLKSAMVSTVWYGAVEQVNKDTGDRAVIAGVCLTGSDAAHGYPFGYKGMDETYGPCEADCPVSILRLLTETDNEYALEWRKRCLENAAKKPQLTKLRALPKGSKVKTKNAKGEEVVLTKKLLCGWKQPRWLAANRNYYIPASTIVRRGFELVYMPPLELC